MVDSTTKGCFYVFKKHEGANGSKLLMDVAECFADKKLSLLGKLEKVSDFLQ